MTQEAIDKMKVDRATVKQALDTTRAEKASVVLNFQQIEDELTGILRDIERKCDHRMPDGTSADDGGFMYGSCRICGKLFD